jgi:hypothetical protein
MKRSLLNQKVTLKDALIQEPEQLLPMELIRDSNVLTSLSLIAIGAVIGMIFLAGVRACDPDMEPVAIQQNCVSCHNEQMSMTIYFKNNGSKTPEEMAYAVLQTKSPKLLAAMAVVESDGNHTVRNTGYKKRHHGAFQVNPRHWGKVHANPVDQAKQAERILEDLTNKHPIKTALSVYGGDSTDSYQKRILTELTRVP